MRKSTLTLTRLRRTAGYGGHALSPQGRGDANPIHGRVSTAKMFRGYNYLVEVTTP
ncbi:MAG: hypothetical protein ABSD58_08850 [Verrucomicrobiia bacterium]|jgi:hypothetical protein